MTLLYISIATIAIATLSLIGIAIFYKAEKTTNKLMLSLVALSAGAMLGNSIFHLLPESFEHAEEHGGDIMHMLMIFAGGFVISFLFEQFFNWHHCHSNEHSEKHQHKSYSHLVLYTDAVHNFIDGLIIAGAFIANPALGISTALAIALHEVPQELGDYAVLVHGGWDRKKALLVNYLVAMTVFAGGVAGFYLANQVEGAVSMLLPFAAGSFIYIAAADLLPELKHEESRKKAIIHFIAFVIGIAIMAVTASVGHGH